MDTKAGFQVLSFNDFDPRIRDYKRRKAHRKTKDGCLTCKAKRVKCDESRPVCVRCQRNSRPCVYSQPGSHGQEQIQSNTVAALRGTSGLSALSATTVVPFFSPDPKNGTSSIHLVQHFQRHWAEIFHMPHSHAIVSLSRSHPLVRSTLFAIAASHLRHVSPLGTPQHRIAEHFQQSLALQDYQRALNTPRDELGQAGVNALLLSGALLNMLAFTLPESETAGGGGSDERPDPSTSWVFSPCEDRLDWLALQVGIKPMLVSIAAYFDEALSFVGPIFLGREKESWAFGEGARGYGLESVPKNWIEVFELDDSTDVPKASNDRKGDAAAPTARPSNVFRPAAMLLAQLRHLEPVRPNVFKNLQFMGKVQPAFRTLLYDRDERALWIFGYWLGLMCRFEGLWWCDERVRRDHRAIRMWLEQLRLAERSGVEGMVWKEMMEELDLAPVYGRT